MRFLSDIKYHAVGTDSFNNKKHYHNDEFEILQIISGNGVMFVKDKLFPIEPGTIFFINGSYAHCSSPEEPLEYKRNKLFFSKEDFLLCAKALGSEDTIKNLFLSSNCAVRLSHEDSKLIDNFILKIYEQKDEKAAQLDFFINLFSIFNTALKCKKNVHPFIKNKTSDIIEFINNNISKKLTLKMISAHTHISKYYLCHIFKKITGMSVFEYINHTRIALAKEFLSKTSKSISEIALDVGFESFAYFSKIFREYENTTPSLYRKNNTLPE